MSANDGQFGLWRRHIQEARRTVSGASTQLPCYIETIDYTHEIIDEMYPLRNQGAQNYNIKVKIY